MAGAIAANAAMGNAMENFSVASFGADTAVPTPFVKPLFVQKSGPSGSTGGNDGTDPPPKLPRAKTNPMRSAAAERPLRPSPPTRALVLGAGGPVGRAWELGLASGLIAQGVTLRTADAIIGTSAGAIAGAHILLGLDLSVLAAAPHLAALPPPSGALTELFRLMARVSQSLTPETVLQEIGRLALDSATASEEQSIQRIGALAKRDWPANFRATAVNVRTGERVVWDRRAGVPLERAVASSCALPGVWPPIIIDGERYMDGGVRSMLNSDLAAGHTAVIIVSCFALVLPEGVENIYQKMLNAGLEAEIASLRGTGACVNVITPSAEFLELTQGGTQMLDAGLSPEAYKIGARQAIQEVSYLHLLWRPA